MTTLYRISSKAIEDIDRIWLYTQENWSQIQANHYYGLIFQEIEFISKNFECGKDISEIRSGYRKYNVKSHIIIYRKGDDNIVEIIRILHQMMDIPNQL
jgi:toxin ParE1/3/4